MDSLILEGRGGVGFMFLKRGVVGSATAFYI